MHWHSSFVLYMRSHFIPSILRFGREFWLNNVNLLENNVAVAKENFLPTYLENNINAILKSLSNLFIGS